MCSERQYVSMRGWSVFRESICEHERLECVQRVKYVSMRGWSVFRKSSM